MSKINATSWKELKKQLRPLQGKPYAEEVLFHDRKLALNYLKEQKIVNKNVRTYRKDEGLDKVNKMSG